MDKMRFSDGFDRFYDKCLAELKARNNYTEAFIPILERYVTITATLSKLNGEIVDEELTTEHTNKAKETNQVSNPKWRMFLALNKEALQLAKELELSPSSAPVSVTQKKKSFDLGGDKMKVA